MTVGQFIPYKGWNVDILTGECESRVISMKPLDNFSFKAPHSAPFWRNHSFGSYQAFKAWKMGNQAYEMLKKSGLPTDLAGRMVAPVMQVIPPLAGHAGWLAVAMYYAAKEAGHCVNFAQLTRPWIRHRYCHDGRASISSVMQVSKALRKFYNVLPHDWWYRHAAWYYLQGVPIAAIAHALGKRDATVYNLLVRLGYKKKRKDRV